MKVVPSSMILYVSVFLREYDTTRISQLSAAGDQFASKISDEERRRCLRPGHRSPGQFVKHSKRESEAREERKGKSRKKEKEPNGEKRRDRENERALL